MHCECSVLFRDEHGKIIPAGAIGKYVEFRNQEGKWLPIHPSDIRRCDKPTAERASLNPFGLETSEELKTAFDKGTEVFQVRTRKERWQMLSLSEDDIRTGPQGDFLLSFTIYNGAEEVLFASPDYSAQGFVVVRYDDPDRALKITLRPVRLVRARVVETPKDEPQFGFFGWDVYSLDTAAGKLTEIPEIGEKGRIDALSAGEAHRPETLAGERDAAP